MQGAKHATENKWREDIFGLMQMAEICCLQECGTLPSTAVNISARIGGYNEFNLYEWNLGTTSRPNYYYILHYYWDSGANRCNLALVTKEMPEQMYIVPNTAWRDGRPAIGILKDGMNYFTIHASAGNHGGDAKQLLEDINDYLGRRYNWATFGDFNREPDELTTPYVICPPNGYTHPAPSPEKSLDYAVLSSGYSIEGQVIEYYMSDHFPVIYRG